MTVGWPVRAHVAFNLLADHDRAPPHAVAQVYQDKTVESMARWNQEKKTHQSSGFVPSAGVVNDSDESESDDSEDATGQPGHLLANGLMQIDKRKIAKNGGAKEKRFRKA